MKTKIIVIFGGVYSSLGKGIIASSIGNILNNHNYKVFMQKMDPYLNVDPGTLSPYQHGEVFVTHDGKESDLDLGNYERFVDKNMSFNSSITSGYIYNEVISDERKGLYNGQTVQVIPHITNKIKNHIYKTIKDESPDFLIIEVGGTVGDIESIPFIEALSQFASEFGKENFLPILCAPLICLDSTSEEVKTKPAQHAIRELGSLGIIPSFLVLRTSFDVEDKVIEKICLNCHMKNEYVFISKNIPSIYFLPNHLYEQGIHTAIFNYFNIKNINKDNFNRWENFTNSITNAKDTIRIALVGKYTSLKDAYMSLYESLKFSGYKLGYNLELGWIDSANITKSNVNKILSNYNGILIPGGFGERGIEGKKIAINYARENKIPFLGICLGMQLALIEFAVNVLKIENANSTEFDRNCFPIFDYIDGTMHLGEEKCYIKKSTLAYEIYKTDMIIQRFRHRYEFNNKLIAKYEQHGIIFSSFCDDKRTSLTSIEIKDHPFFFACQYHPEFSSKPNNPELSIFNFVKASLKKQNEKK